MNYTTNKENSLTSTEDKESVFNCLRNFYFVVVLSPFIIKYSLNFFKLIILFRKT